MSNSKSQDPPPREACDECHTRKIRCPSATGACLNCRTAGRICTFGPRKGMGRPKNSERKKARKSDLISSPAPDDFVTATLPLHQLQHKHDGTLQTSTGANSHPVTGPTLLAEHDFLQDFSYNATESIPTKAAQEQQIMPNAPFRSYSSSNTLGPVYQERTVYHSDPNNLSNTDSTMSDLFHPCATTPVEKLTWGQTPSQSSIPQPPPQDIFSRLSSIQMGLWKRKDHGQKTLQKHHNMPSNAKIYDFIQTASDICSIAEAAAGWSHDLSSSATSSHDLETFYFQLMMSVSSVLDILSNLENPSLAGFESHEHSKNMTQSSCPNLVQMRSSFFVLPSLKDSERLNMLLTLTTLDFYLGQMSAVLSKIDTVAKIDGLRQGVDEVVGRSQQFRRLISSSLRELQGRQ
ncbi:MAG: hypothetical protein LQ343_004614 [Gyalolechia ehrenbergii]|nr:MAG: hypothetical protein LQ343_004614 [Gyalolechia ehrenbergii]